MTSEEPQLLTLSSELSENEFTEMISISIICRLCANQSDRLIGIYSEDGITNALANKLNMYLPVKVSETDNLPLQCCWQCASTVLAWHDLVVTSVEADRRLRSYQFVTEKQLEEITYGATESILSNNEEESLKSTNEPENLISSKKEDSIVSDSSENELDTTATGECKVIEENLSMKSADTSIEKNYQHKKCRDFENTFCIMCKTFFASKLIHKKHLATVHDIKVAKKRRKKSELTATFTCLVCNKAYTRKHDMEKHVKVQHPEERIIKKHKNKEIILKSKVQTPSGVQYQCDFCAQTFSKSYTLTRHRMIHTNDKPHCCHICGKKFRVTSSLSRHINEHHNNIRNFKCEVCDMTFKNRTTREEHMNIHNNVRPFVCDICGKSFKQSASLYVHKKFHSKEAPFGCTLCDKKFKRKQNLKTHSLYHSGERPYRCRHCNMTFKVDSDLRRHKKAHVPAFCDKCGIRFKQVRYLKMHEKSCKQSLEGMVGKGINEPENIAENRKRKEK